MPAMAWSLGYTYINKFFRKNHKMSIWGSMHAPVCMNMWKPKDNLGCR